MGQGKHVKLLKTWYPARLSLLVWPRRLENFIRFTFPFLKHINHSYVALLLLSIETVGELL